MTTRRWYPRGPSRPLPKNKDRRDAKRQYETFIPARLWATYRNASLALDRLHAARIHRD